MHTLKKIVFWLISGSVFGVGFVVASYYTLRILMPDKSDVEFVHDYIDTEQESFGITCEELIDKSSMFIDKSIKPIVEAGRNGQDWVAMSNSRLLEELEWHEQKTYKCHLMKGNADRVGLPMEGDFDTMQQLFSALRTFMTPYGNEPPSANGLSPGAFERVDQLYSNLTMGLSATPESADALSSAP